MTNFRRFSDHLLHNKKHHQTIFSNIVDSKRHELGRNSDQERKAWNFNLQAISVYLMYLRWSLHIPAHQFRRRTACQSPFHLWNICSCSDMVKDYGTSPEVGFTEDYVPVASTSLNEMYDATLIAGDDLAYIDSNYSVNCFFHLDESETAHVLFFPPSPPFFFACFRFTFRPTASSTWASCVSNAC